MMKRRSIRIFLLLLAVLTLSALLIACGENPAPTPEPEPKPEEHRHTYSEAWSADADAHWHTATCEHTDLIKDRAAHTPVTDPAVPATTTSTGLTEGAHCSVCGYVIRAQQVLPKEEPDPAPSPDQPGEDPTPGEPDPVLPEDVTLPDGDFTYDGTVHSLTVSGELPAGVTVTYEGNGQTNAGIYTVTATFRAASGRVIGTRTATLTVRQATYKLVVLFKETSIEYDGEPHSITLRGNLPAGLTVTYEGNGQTEVGVYTIRAIFHSADDNYATPDPMETTLTIFAGEKFSAGLLTETRADGTLTVVGYEGTDTEVWIPGMWKKKAIVSLASDAFRGNTAITAVHIGARVTNIGNNTFDGCTALATVTFGDAVTNIGNCAFRGTALREIRLPQSLLTIGKGAFTGTRAEKMTLPFIGGSRESSKTYLGYLFGATAAAQNAEKVPSTLTEVTVLGTAGTIPVDAFRGCSSLVSVTVEDGVTRVENNAFSGCTSLTEVHLPASVTEIPADAYPYNSPFYGCSASLTVYYARTEAYTALFGRYWLTVAEGVTAHAVYAEESKM